MNENLNDSMKAEQSINSTKEEMFLLIKELQKLPDEVVEKFLQSKGKLANVEFSTQLFTK
jgi:hypothetical protein